MAHIAIVATDSWYIWNFRAETIRQLKDDGHAITCYCGNPEYMDRLKCLGVTTRILDLYGRNAKLRREIHAIVSLIISIRKDRPDIVLSFNPKGNLYSGIAARFCKFRWIANVSGLGLLGEKTGVLGNALRRLFRFSFKTVDHVVFQNAEDLEVWATGGIVLRHQSTRQFGSGINLKDFRPTPPPIASLCVICLARLLKKKGIGEFITLAENVRKTYPDIRFQLAGKPVSVAEGGIPETMIQDAQRAGHIHYLGMLDDVRPLLDQRAIGCLLTSYNEGLPRSMIEFLAAGRPIIISAFRGSEDLVAPRESGKVVDLADPEWINSAKSFIAKCHTDGSYYAQLCHNARDLAVQRFDGDVGIRDYQKMIGYLLSG